ncbi:ABC transporter permease [Corynebacterium endometrii]|uniref:ABC-2 family transporter protein n=1 Tax=Corynebacterium endometrii TaxID=2488819 RepID=A0A4P7QJP0_9CORY|nr:ABC transporter permease [Corynebacterium endometrii]QCB29286.1 ABC-2 family transporter protein [Corynebacterium endometrii]
MKTLKAEWTKLRTTKSFWWTTGVFFFFLLGWALLNTSLANSMGIEAAGPITPQATVQALYPLALPVLLIQAIMVVTTEYRYGLQSTVYMANPRRWQVPVAKYVLYAVIAAVLVLVGVAGAYAIGGLFGNEEVTAGYDPFGSDAGRHSLWVSPLAAVLLVLFGQGLGLLLRQTAGTVAISLILYLGLDSLILLLPKVGEKIVNFMPFTAFQRWTSDMAPPPDAPFDSATGYLVVFIVWSAVLWISGVLLLQKRDV